ncbi:uncharacterized protein LAESUDRAFT_760480 [Laetiporus sulphureus 93-53]|uniref:Uncharacterized protein n=1 Tax=Laetiporus sulphureus 93-53 TaxID=1314785 RepID=A0A165DP52_9APHY|nr:uncharacterized protein LAESUDRAFT_760480 [Laetiporus sulphureus 93-53]KZT05315.1 hypothetical protein LAESUDRAFT_760480 [Laetiporus sulphureus 93-53]
MKKILRTAAAHAIDGRTWKKFTNLTVGWGKTVFPQYGPEQEQLSVRWDYDGETVDSDDTVYHKFQLQPNTGKVPTTIKRWREANGGTHTVMADVYVKKDGTKEDVEESLKAAIEKVEGV